jgi:hypothetical protein
MAMIALKCPEVEVVVLDINEGTSSSNNQAMKASRAAATCTKPLLGAVASLHSSFLTASTTGMLPLQIGLLPGTVRACPFMSLACMRW